MNHHPVFLTIAAATHDRDQPELLSLLLEDGSRIHEWDMEGNTCLHLTIAAARPDQPWCCRFLVLLIYAGADPNQSNHSGFTAFDLACTGSSEFGSFRRDLLLHALLQSGGDIPDERLMAPTKLTTSYTRTHHAMICGAATLNIDSFFKATLLERVFNVVGYRNPELQKASVDRVLSAYGPTRNVRQDDIFHDALTYLQRMREGKQQLSRMVKERLSHQTRRKCGQGLDWTWMSSQAETTALLEFDWFRPVDIEDVFVSYVDNLIEQLEGSWPNSKNLERVIEALENAIPSYRATSVKERTSGTPSLCSGSRMYDKDDPKVVTCKEILTLSIPSDAERAVGQTAEERARQDSIIKTPVEYYGPGSNVNKGCATTNMRILKSSKDVKQSLSSGTKRLKLRFSTRRRGS